MQKPLEKLKSTNSEIHWSYSSRARRTLAFSLKMKAKRLAVITEMSFFVTYKPFCISNDRKGHIFEQEPWNCSKSRESAVQLFFTLHTKCPFCRDKDTTVFIVSLYPKGKTWWFFLYLSPEKDEANKRKREREREPVCSLISYSLSNAQKLYVTLLQQIGFCSEPTACQTFWQ